MKKLVHYSTQSSHVFIIYKENLLSICPFFASRWELLAVGSGGLMSVISIVSSFNRFSGVLATAMKKK